MTEYYLSTPEVAEELGINLSTLNSRIKSGDFPDADGLTGGRTQGWLQSTVDALKDDAPGGFKMDFDAVLAIIVQLRWLAEQVRFYGQGDTEDGNGISGNIPDELYMILGRLESTVRRFMCAEVRVNARFAEVSLDPETSQHSIDALALRHQKRLEDFAATDVVPTYTNGAGGRETDSVRAGALRQIAHRIADEQRALRRAFIGLSAAAFYNKLSDVTAKIHAYADSLAPDDELRNAMNGMAAPGILAIAEQARRLESGHHDDA